MEMDPGLPTRALSMEDLIAAENAAIAQRMQQTTGPFDWLRVHAPTVGTDAPPPDWPTAVALSQSTGQDTVSADQYLCAALPVAFARAAPLDRDPVGVLAALTHAETAIREIVQTPANGAAMRAWMVATEQVLGREAAARIFLLLGVHASDAPEAAAAAAMIDRAAAAVRAHCNEIANRAK